MSSVSSQLRAIYIFFLSFTGLQRSEDRFIVNRLKSYISCIYSYNNDSCVLLFSFNSSVMVFTLGCKELIPLFSILAGPASVAVFSTIFKFDHWLEMVSSGCLPVLNYRE